MRLLASWTVALISTWILLWSSGAQASPTLWLEVTRAREAELCPDSTTLRQTVARLFDQRVVRAAENAQTAALVVSIAITHEPSGFVASLRVSQERWSERRIVDVDPECRGLPEALAVAVVLLVEPHAERKQRAQAAPARATPRSQRRVQLELGLTALSGLGILGAWDYPAAGAALSLSAYYGHFGLRTRGLRWLPLAHSLGDGSITLDAWAAAFGPCGRVEVGTAFSLSPCLELALGQQHETAHGFGGASQDSAPWRVLSLELTGSARLVRGVFATASLGGVVPLHRQRYRVEGGPAANQGPLSPLFSLGISGSWEIVRGH